MRRWVARLVVLVAIVISASACDGPSAQPAPDEPAALASATFLADIAQNIAGERMAVSALIPMGMDPHSFEPTPQDAARVADSRILIVNGAGFEAFLAALLQNAGGERRVIEAAAGLTPRAPQGDEPAEAGAEHAGEVDPHFWLDPTQVIRYSENIRAGLTAADPDGEAVYTANAQAYAAQLNELDAWITAQVAQIPPERRLLVTNHESFGYFADRYGFRVVGAVVPSVSAAASPSAQELAALTDQIKKTGARAIFLEAGASPQLAEQVAAETGVKVVTGLLTHSVTPADGPAPDYLSMMRYNVRTIVDALK